MFIDLLFNNILSCFYKIRNYVIFYLEIYGDIFFFRGVKIFFKGECLNFCNCFY